MEEIRNFINSIYFELFKAVQSVIGFILLILKIITVIRKSKFKLIYIICMSTFILNSMLLSINLYTMNYLGRLRDPNLYEASEVEFIISSLVVVIFLIVISWVFFLKYIVPYMNTKSWEKIINKFEVQGRYDKILILKMFLLIMGFVFTPLTVFMTIYFLNQL